MKNIDFSDVLIFMGLSLLGVGLFFCVGLGVALAVDGALLIGFGVWK